MANLPLKILCISVLFYLPLTSLGQHLYDTSFIEKNYDRSLWGLVNNSYDMSYQMIPNHSSAEEGNMLDFKQQNWLEYGVTFAKNNQRSYISLFSIPGEDTMGKGKSELYAGAYESADKNYLTQTSFSYAKGFFDGNTSNYSTYYDSTKRFVNQPNMVQFNLKSSYWNFKNYKKFSYNAAYHYIQRQKKSSGSLFSMGEINYNYTKNSAGLIPDYADTNFSKELESVRTLNAPALSVGGGITGTLVIDKFFLNGLALLKGGAAYHIYSSKDNVFEQQHIQALFGFNVHSSIGFNLDRFVFAYNFRYTNNVSWNRNVSLSRSFLVGSLFIGYRFR